VMIAYFVLVLGFGSFFGKHAKSTKDFFFSGQRFSWWLIAFSCVATVVGSYSFIKYSERGLSFGMSSTMTYLNDWFLAPLFILGWMPLIYFSRVKSIPEYFEKRFNRPARVMAIFFIMLYMVGYIGINLFTLGVAVNKIAPLDRHVAVRYSAEELVEEVTVKDAKDGKRKLANPDGRLVLDEDGMPVPLKQALEGKADDAKVLVYSKTPENTSRFLWALVIALVAGVYVTFGGQTAVIMTDLVQGVLLLVVGVALLILGIWFLGDHVPGMGGLAAWWKGMPEAHQMPFSGFNRPGSFPMVGIFWQDFFGSSMFFYFANQGLIMRFLAVKSPNEGRKAIVAVILVLMPIAAIAVAAPGWIGTSMQTYGLMRTNIDPNNAFVLVSAAIVQNDFVFGIILAAITAALMSTVDTLINAVAAIAVNDIMRPFIAPGRDDKFYLKWARIFSMGFTFGGLALVPIYMGFDSIYDAHGAFTAAISPPIIVAIILGITWKRYSARAAFATLLLGGVMVGISIYWDDLVKPFAWLHGMDMETGLAKSLKYMRAMYGIVICSVIAVGATLIWPNKDDDVERISGLWVGTIQAAKRFFKGGEPNDDVEGKKARLILTAGEDEELDETGAEVTAFVTVSKPDAEVMKAKDGDLVYVADKRWWLGGLRSLHATLRVADADAGKIIIPKSEIKNARLIESEEVVVEKII